MTQHGEPERLFFDNHQWNTVEAAMARIIPTDHDPGATEANTVRFVDRYLSGIEYIYANPDGSGFRSLSGKEVKVWQSRIRNLQAKYVEGLAQLDRVSQQQFSNDFLDLTADDQDQVLREIARPLEGTLAILEEAGATAAFVMPEASMQQAVNEHDLDFFPLLALHTRQGFYADPVYGGNQGHVGWKTIGFPGPESMSEVQGGHYSTLPYFANSSTITQPGEQE